MITFLLKTISVSVKICNFNQHYPITLHFPASVYLKRVVLALARYGASGHNSSWRGWGWAQYAAELRILLVYVSESLGRLGQHGGLQGATFS